MSILDAFFKKKKPILNDEDVAKLEEIRRKAYFEEASKLVESNAREKARNDLGIKKKVIY